MRKIDRVYFYPKNSLLMTTFLNLFSAGSTLFSAIPGSFSWRLRFQKDDKLLSTDKRNQIESKIQELAQKLGISKPIELIEKKGLMTGAQAQGIAFFSGRAGIAIDPDIAHVIPEAELEFVIAHELSHIKANDAMWMGVASSIVGLITTLAMSILFPSSVAFSSTVATLILTSPAALVGLLVSVIALVVFSKWREECADKLGFSVCSDAAQKAAPQFFDSMRASQIEYRNNEEGSCLSRMWRRFLITEDGECRLDILHPSLKTRIKYLQSI
jgi:Zn-dependent protease with chaperone function